MNPSNEDCPVLRAVLQQPQLARYLNTFAVQRDAEKIVLTGRLPSFYLKQLLQESVRRGSGGARIDNLVVVEPE